MEVDEGIIEVQIAYKKIDDKVVNAVVEKSLLTKDEAEKILRYNIITPVQLSNITGVKLITINVKRSMRLRSGKVQRDLKVCYPFYQKKEEQKRDNQGPIFIYRDEDCESFIRISLGLEEKKKRRKVKEE